MKVASSSNIYVFVNIMIKQLDFKNLTHFRHAPRRMQVIHLHEFCQASHIGCCLCPIEDTNAIGFDIAPPAASIWASGDATMVCSRAAARICLRGQKKNAVRRYWFVCVPK